MVYMLFPKMCRFQVSDFQPLYLLSFPFRNTLGPRHLGNGEGGAVTQATATFGGRRRGKSTCRWKSNGLWSLYQFLKDYLGGFFSHVQTELPIELYLWCKDYSIFMFIKHDDDLPLLFICVYDRITKVLLHSHID